MSVVIGSLAFVGGLVVGKVIYEIVRELVRAARQAVRIAHVVARAKGRDNRPGFRLWWRAFRRDLFSSYSTMTIRFVELPRNPSKPIRARLPF